MSDDRDQEIETRLTQPDDPDQIRKGQQDLLPPPGWWTTVPPLAVTTALRDEEPNVGRLTMRFFGEMTQEAPATVDAEGNSAGPTTLRTRQGFGLSPDRVNRVDKNGRDMGTPDNQYALYLAARQAYTEAYGNAPTSPLDVRDFVRDYPVQVRLVQTGIPTPNNPAPAREPGVFIVQVRAIR